MFKKTLCRDEPKFSVCLQRPFELIAINAVTRGKLEICSCVNDNNATCLNRILNKTLQLTVISTLDKFGHLFEISEVRKLSGKTRLYRLAFF